MGIKTVPQPPFSPDVAPCDFLLFPKLRGCRYETIEEMKEAVAKVIDTRRLIWACATSNQKLLFSMGGHLDWCYG